MAVTFDDLLKQIPNEAVRTALASADDASKQTLSNLFMMQSDYNRELDKNRAALTELDALRQKADQWKAFYDGQKPEEWKRRFTEYPQLETKIQQLQQEIATRSTELEAARAAATGEIFDAEKMQGVIATNLKGQFATREEMNAAVQAAIKQTLEQSTKQTEGVLGFYDEILKYSHRAQTELGEAIDTKTLAAEAQKTGSVEAAYRNLTGEKYTQRKIDEAVTKAREEERVKVQGEMQGRMHTEDSTGSQAGFADRGHFESAVRPDAKDLAEIPADYELGQGAVGKLAGADYQKLAAEGKLQ